LRSLLCEGGRSPTEAISVDASRLGIASSDVERPPRNDGVMFVVIAGEPERQPRRSRGLRLLCLTQQREEGSRELAHV
ncbi:MAG: hypothetical protein IKZ87_06395, partial [Actinomycetaceae bacterium]|nr:hypothetical protein [Actinomycetaceae bacterium]